MRQKTAHATHRKTRSRWISDFSPGTPSFTLSAKLLNCKGAVELASNHKTTIIPQPLQKSAAILLAHHFLVISDAGRDIERLDSCLTRVDVMPLGSGRWPALLTISTANLAHELGFKEISRTAWTQSPTAILSSNLKPTPACA